MRVISFELFWSMVDAIDLYIGGNLSRAKYVGLIGDEFHYPRIRSEWDMSPTTAIKAMILMRYQGEGVKVCIRPKEWIVIRSSTSLESILAMVKSRYKAKKL